MVRPSNPVYYGTNERKADCRRLKGWPEMEGRAGVAVKKRIVNQPASTALRLRLSFSFVGPLTNAAEALRATVPCDNRGARE
jgi:hypothetical protein